MSLNPDNQSAMPSHHQTEPPSYKSTFVGVILHVRTPSFTPMPGVYFQLKLISTPLIIPHDNHGHDHDHHDFFQKCFIQTTRCAVLYRDRALFLTQTNQNNPLPPMTSDLSNCQTKSHWNTQKLVTCGLKLALIWTNVPLHSDYTSRLDTWRLEQWATP